MQMWCGIDWAEHHHDVAIIDDTGAADGAVPGGPLDRGGVPQRPVVRPGRDPVTPPRSSSLAADAASVWAAIVKGALPLR
jgi:hypothetical protein